MRRLAFLFVLLAIASSSFAQAPYFTLEIDEVATSNAPHIHSTATAQDNGLWLFVSGRIDGLHLLFGGEAFPANMSNNDIIVYDPVGDQVWTASLDELTDAVADPLRTTNAQFWQDGSTLYVLGGYGYEHATDEKISFGTITAIDVPGIISAVQNATPLSTHIRQTANDDRFRVTGGHLIQFEGTYHLVGGNRFDGEYLGGFVQTYTEAVRSFDIVDNGTTISISNYVETSDTDNLHRRDVNVAPVILEDGSEGFALFGGVFQVSANLPHRNPIYFDGSSMTVDTDFDAEFGHYTSPIIPLYDADANAELMHTVFFGGMNQFYYDETDELVKEDILVPFTDDVTMITQENNGNTTEMVLPTTLPALLGSNAVLFLDPALPRYDNGVIKLRELSGRTLIGHVIGGIESDMPNAGWMGGTTLASNRLFELHVTPLPVANENQTPEAFNILPPSPNPFSNETRLSIYVNQPQSLSVEVFDLLGRHVATLHEGPLPTGQQTFSFRPEGVAGGVYTVRIASEGGIATQRIVYVR